MENSDYDAQSEDFEMIGDSDNMFEEEANEKPPSDSGSSF
jgi:hypothetical protein